MHGATSGAAKRETVMPKSGEAMTGNSTTTGAAAGTGENKGTATGGNPGGNASKKLIVAALIRPLSNCVSEALRKRRASLHVASAVGEMRRGAPIIVGGSTTPYAHQPVPACRHLPSRVNVPSNTTLPPASRTIETNVRELRPWIWSRAISGRADSASFRAARGPASSIPSSSAKRKVFVVRLEEVSGHRMSRTGQGWSFAEPRRATTRSVVIVRCRMAIELPWRAEFDPYDHARASRRRSLPENGAGCRNRTRDPPDYKSGCSTN